MRPRWRRESSIRGFARRDYERTHWAARSNNSQHPFGGISSSAAQKDRGAGGSGAVAGGFVPGVLRGAEFAGASSGEPAVSGPHRFGENPHRGSRCGDSVWRIAGSNQGGLRGVPALARDRQADRFTSRISGTPGDASADHPGSVVAISHGEAEAEFFAV